MNYIPAYRLHRIRAGIKTDREMGVMAGLPRQRVPQWTSSRSLRREEAEALAELLKCQVTEIWEPETGRPVFLA